MENYNSHETKRMQSLHGLELASFGQRAGAFLIDVAFASGLFSMIYSILEPILLKQGWIHSQGDIAFKLNMNGYSVAWVILYFGLGAFLGKGKTPGKRIFGIRVISLTRERLAFWQSIERSIGYGYSFIELCFGFFQFFFYPNRRTLHDRVAETIVIRERKKKK